MTNRQTIDDLLARLTDDITEARLEAASAAVRAERERADRHRAEAAAYMEILEDVRESLELLAPVSAPKPATPPPGATCDRSVPPDASQVADPDGWYSNLGQCWPWCFMSERVEVRFRDGTRWSGLACNVTWGHQSEPKDIIKWRPESAPVGTDGVSMADALGWHRRYYSGAAGYPTGTATVDYQRRNGMFGRKDAGLLDWTMTGDDGDIVRWRLTPDHTSPTETTP